MNSDKHQDLKLLQHFGSWNQMEKKKGPSLVPVSVSQYGPTSKFFKT